MAKRVLIAGFKHETNTFSALPTTMESYKARHFARGADVVPAFKGTNTEVAAFLDGCEKHGWEPILSTVADATPSGKVAKDCYEAIVGDIVGDAVNAGKLDAILLNLHGAMVAEHTDDGEGTLLERLRAKVGPDVVIAATLDLHANVTKAMAANADILVSYRTYPHIDMYDIATEVVDLVKRTLDGQLKPKTFIARRPQIEGVDHGRTTAPGPMTEILARCAKMKSDDPEILAMSINAAFAWADIPEVGPTAVVVGNGTDPRFQAMAESLADDIWKTRHHQTVALHTVADALARAKAVGKIGKPAVINDPEAAAACHDAGIGTTLTVKIGGKVDPSFGAPIEATGVVTHLSDGKITIEGPMMRGLTLDMGPTATLKIGGVEVVIGSRRFQNYDRNFFRAGGIEPSERAILAVKSAQHFRAAYAPIASEVIVVDEGGGIVSHDLSKLPFTRVPRPIYPLDDI